MKNQIQLFYDTAQGWPRRAIKEPHANITHRLGTSSLKKSLKSSLIISTFFKLLIAPFLLQIQLNHVKLIIYEEATQFPLVLDLTPRDINDKTNTEKSEAYMEKKITFCSYLKISFFLKLGSGCQVKFY